MCRVAEWLERRLNRADNYQRVARSGRRLSGLDMTGRRSHCGAGRPNRGLVGASLEDSRLDRDIGPWLMK